ncbi:MAG: winged helix-turn-helix domain-containing protein, partial [Candidatus Eremiobacterota bacterium]
KNNNFKEIPGLKLNIGWDYYQLGELDIAYEFLKEGLDIAHTDRLRVYSLYFTAMVYEEKGEDERAFSYFSKALEISKKLEDVEKQLIISTMMARLYVKIKKYKEAKQIVHENKYLLNEDYSYIKRENLLILAEIELMEGNFKESLVLAGHVLKEAHRDVDVFQLFIASYLMSLLSEEEGEIIKWRNEAAALLDKLFGHEKRKAMKYFASLEKFLVKELTCITTKINSENYRVKLGEKEYYSDFAGVEKLKSDMSSFDLFIDLAGCTVWEHTAGFIDFSRKRNLASLLFYFVRNRGKSFTLEELYSAIWKSKFYKNDGSTVKTSISRLRKLLEPEPEKPKYIKIFSLPYQKESKYYFSEDVNFCFIEKMEQSAEYYE